MAASAFYLKPLTIVSHPILKYILLLCALCLSPKMWAQHPLYVVNGELREEIQFIPPEMIERVEVLPADEETITRFGEAASHGVILVTLIYDRAARFVAEGLSFEEWIIRQVKWSDEEPAARVIVRYEVGVDGVVRMGEVLEATDKRLLRRLRKAFAEAPCWEPATKVGEAVVSHDVLCLQLPKGRSMPRERYIVIR